MQKSIFLITGTGRAGTTFLTRLLTQLALPTGYNADSCQKHIYEWCNAGLERVDFATLGVEIFKSPNFATKIPDLVAQHRIVQIIIPIRTITDAAHSRVSHGNTCGGLWCATDLESQKAHLRYVLSEAVAQCTLCDVPFTTIAFPRMVVDCEYLFLRLEVLLKHYNVDRETFFKAFAEIADVKKVHEFECAKTKDDN